MTAHRYVPRDYMDEAIAAVLDDLLRVWSTLLVMATGTGKTWAFLQVARRLLGINPGQRVMVVAHRDELIFQPAHRWQQETGFLPAIEKGNLRAGCPVDLELFDASAPTDDRLVIASIQTLNSGKRCRRCTLDCGACNREGVLFNPCAACEGDGCDDCKGSGQTKTKCKECRGDGWVCVQEACDECFEHYVLRMMKFDPLEFDLIILDEAHHAPAGTYTRFIRYCRSRNPRIKLVGCTATPDRADEEALGQVFESVAYTYSLPDPITDGWLTPIEQQYIVVDGLNLANIPTVAGDLSRGGLEQEMLAEKVLHKVVTPLIEIACGLEPGTIDRLLASGTLHELESLITRREPTLIHAVDVAHAERMTEIINRYLPDAALCIIGTTPQERRRDGLKRFAEGKHQFLLSCGVFLEGTDLPNVGIIGMARPTKSRALYSQMLGRGLRPLSGLIDGIPTAEERRLAIAESGKPRCLVVDFVGNSGRHKLISSADILGDAYPDELVEGVIRKAAKDGVPVDMLRTLQDAREAEEKTRQDRNRKEAAARLEAEERARKEAAQRRAGIVAGATYTAEQINPFDVFNMAPSREPGYHKGRKATAGQKEVLRKGKIPFSEDVSFWEADRLVKEQLRRWKHHLCTFKQAKWLTERGYDPDTRFEKARTIMDAWSQNKWQRPDAAEFERQKLAEIGEAERNERLNEIGIELVRIRKTVPPGVYQKIVEAGKARRTELTP